MRVVFFDLETGGFDPRKHAITQIAMIAVEFSDLSIVDEFEVKVQFRTESATKEALAINSYDAEVWEKEAINPRDACSQVSRFLKRFANVEMVSKAGKPYFIAQLVGHNADTFDGPFLREWFRRLDVFCPGSFGVLDTIQRARWAFMELPEVDKPENMKLGTLADYFSIPIDAHDALGDVRATLEVYKAIVNLSRGG